MTNPLPPSNLSDPPAVRVFPLLISQILIGVIIAGAFVGLYVGLQRAPTPHHLPLAIVGSALAVPAQEALGQKANITTSVSDSNAEQLVKNHAAVAALIPTGFGLRLVTAGAAGRSATAAATAIAAHIASAAHMKIISTEDLVPLVKYDAQGLSGFYVVFGSTLASFIVAQILQSMAAIIRLRWRVVTVLVGSVASSLIATILAGPIYGVIPAPPVELLLCLSLLGAAVALSTMAIVSWVGPLGNIIATLLFTTLGNATSGATISAFLMPPFFAKLGALLPPGAAFNAVVNFSYFHGTNTGGTLLILTLWIAAASGALILHTRRATHRLPAADESISGAGCP
jgi:hypothetical protein